MKRVLVLPLVYATCILPPHVYAQKESSPPGLSPGSVAPPSSLEVPASWQEEARKIIEDDPQIRRLVDEFLGAYGLPARQEITDEELTDLMNVLDDPRGQPVAPNGVGPTLAQAWMAIHPDKRIPPEILNLAHEEACSGPASALISLREELRLSGGHPPFKPSSFEDESSVASAVTIIDGYLEACLEEPEILGKTRDWLDNVVGLLRYKGDSAETCIGTLVGPKHVLTARHCLFNFHDSRWKPRAWRSLYFFLPIREAERRLVIRVINPPGALPDVLKDEDDRDDWAILVLENPILDAEEASLEELNNLDKLLLYGAQPLVRQRDKLAEAIGGAKLAIAPIDFVRVDRAQSCRSLLKSKDGCITHGCQSEGGVSGAPLFRVSHSGTGLSVVAIHQGEVSVAYKGTCLSENQQRLPNRGRAVTADLIATVRKATDPLQENHK